MDLEAELQRLKSLHEKGLIDEASYREEMKAVLAQARTGGATDSALPSGAALTVTGGTAGFELENGMVIGTNARQFKLEVKLGGGAMGQVWKAQDVAESQVAGQAMWVAVKALNPLLLTADRYREALKREAINAKKLAHPGIVRTHDWYEDNATIWRFPFFVMEYLEGETLDRTLAKHQRFDLEAALGILRPIAEALDYAWEKHRIVHRDLKPENVLLSAGGEIKLLDFGIAAQARHTALAQGLAGFESPGTPGYAPPEAGAHGEPDPRFDIYSLGILSYELLAGAIPYPGLRRRDLQAAKPAALNEGQWQTLQKAMAYEVTERHGNARGFLAEMTAGAGPSEAERKEAERAEARQRENEAARQRVEAEKRQAEEKAAQDVATAKAEAERKARQAKEEQEKAQAEAKRLKDELERRQREETGGQSRKPETKLNPLHAAGVALVVGVIAVGVLVGKREAAPTPTPTPTPVAAPAPAAVPAPAQPAAALPTPTSAAAPSPSAVSPAPSLRAGQVIKDCAECPEMVVIPAGSFEMGSTNGDSDEKPVHTVRIAKPFALGRTEVTRGQFAAFVAASGHTTADGCYVWNGGWDKDGSRNWRNPGYAQTDSHPVVCVSWDDAKAYVNWLSRKTGKDYRLPSEAEQEYATRAGSTGTRPWGENPDEACGYANVADRSAKASVPGASGWSIHNCDDGHAYTAPVASFRPNPFGLYDTMGNVWEWTQDCWNGSYNGAPTDGSAWTGGDCARRVLRGGSWGLPRIVRAAIRSYIDTTNRNNDIGFRLARMLP